MVSIKLDPLDPADRSVASSLLGFSVGTVEFSTWVRSWDARRQGTGPFDNVFDATMEGTGQEEMHKIPPSAFDVGDLVIVDGYVKKVFSKKMAERKLGHALSYSLSLYLFVP